MPRSDLPPVVRAYLERCLPPGRQAVQVTLKQRGQMRLAPERPWLPFRAEQTVSAVGCEFLWRARVRMAPLTVAHVRDGFRDGHGQLDARLWGVLPVARGRGPGVDRGELQRYLAELPWCPFALAHNPEIAMRSLSEREVRCWVGEPECYVDLRFDDAGDIVEVHTEARPKDARETLPWTGRFWDYRDFGGVRAPAHGEVWWDRPEGRYVYFQGEITSLVFAAAPGG